jgi:hypothetical protein
MDLFFLTVPDSRINYDPSHPAFQRAFEPELVEIIKDSDKSVLQDVFSFLEVKGIPAANG